MYPKASLSQDGYECVYIVSVQTILCNLKLGLSVSTKYLEHTKKLLKAVKHSHNTVMFATDRTRKHKTSLAAEYVLSEINRIRIEFFNFPSVIT
jgi:hypothetical protein